jgi:hypothetical protein
MYFLAHWIWVFLFIRLFSVPDHWVLDLFIWIAIIVVSTLQLDTIKTHKSTWQNLDTINIYSLNQYLKTTVQFYLKAQIWSLLFWNRMQ